MRRVIWLLFVISNSTFANIVISNPNDSFYDFEVELYEDVNKSLDFEDIKTLDKFTPISNKISKGYSKSNFWIRFNLQNISQEDIDSIIYFTENLSHEVDCYIVSEDGSVEKQRQGVGYFVTGAKNKLDNPKFNFHIKSGETKSIYIRFFSLYPNFSAFYILNKDEFNSYKLHYNMRYGLYFGAMVALLLYNMFLYLFSRDSSYLLYSTLVLSLLIWQLALNNFFPMDSFSSTDSYYRAGSPVAFFITFLILFSRKILNLKKIYPRLDRFILYMGYLSLFLAILAVIFLHEAYPYINLLATFAFPFLLYVGFLSYRRGNKVALFYIIAQASFLPLSTLFSLMSDGHIEYSLITRHGMPIGSSIEMILFSLGLAYRIRLLEQEKLDVIYTSNIELEDKVKERTKELEVSKMKLFELANRDSLTNLYNRRYLFERSKMYINIRKPLTLIILDIDKFKNINDTYGHAIGDIAIKLFAKIALKNVREDDILSRIGGEEFVILLPNTTTKEAYNIATKIRKDIEKSKVDIDENSSFRFTTSGGIDILKDKESDIHQLLHRADQALYQAKESGRNKIVVYEEGMG